MVTRGTITAALLALAAAACGASREKPEPKPAPAPIPAPRLPSTAGRLAPSYVDAPPGPGTKGDYLANVEDCSSCHAAVAAQWAQSMHSLSSFNNPIYKVAFDRLRDDAGKGTSRFCAGCHDLPLLVDGAMDRDIAPDDPRAHAGVACRTCHGITHIAPDGNASFSLRADPIPIPDTSDKASVAEHKRAASRERFGAKLCEGCHRSFLGTDTRNAHHLNGQDEVTSWRSSAYAGAGLSRVDSGVDQHDCIGCHMPKIHSDLDDPAADAQGRVHSHQFLGGHTWMASMLGDEPLMEASQAFLRNIVSADVASVREDGRDYLGADGAPATAGADVTFDVVLRNLGVGHNLPAGVVDLQDSWIEVDVTDARGRLIASTGHGHRRGKKDPSAHVLRVTLADEEARPLYKHETNLFRASIVDHTIAPRDAAVVSYHFRMPDRVAGPVRIDARLVHRTRNLELQQAACEVSKSPEGRALTRARESFRGVALDPCKPQPITTLAEDAAVLGGPPPADPRPRWQRLYELGMARDHAVQEDLDSARTALDAALAELDAQKIHGQPRAAVLAEMGKMAGRQGRTDEALALLDRADAEAPGNLAIARICAAALMRVWRWDEAVAPLRLATARAPTNLDGHVALAVTLGSLGRDAEALDAARAGLLLQPREPSLLRVQALALRGLGAPSEAALAAYDQHRPPDEATDLRIRCAAASPDCARERTPVHTHELVPAR